MFDLDYGLCFVLIRLGFNLDLIWYMGIGFFLDLINSIFVIWCSRDIDIKLDLLGYTISVDFYFSIWALNCNLIFGL